MVFARLVLCIALGLICHVAAPARALELGSTTHAMAMHATPKYGPGFSHFDYVNPDAPKGGTLTLAAVTPFDNFNPFILKGVSAPGAGLLYDTLTTRSDDEPFSEYGLVAESMTLAPDNAAITFHLRPEAVFANGDPVTAEDVAFTFRTLLEHGAPLYKRYYADVAEVVVEDEQTVRFAFATTQNLELPLILGQLPVLPKAYWEGRDFAAVTLDVPYGSGPYAIEEFKAGQEVRYRRREDYWAKDLPVNKGRHNVDVIRHIVFLDDAIALTAFKAGEFDFRLNRIAKAWATQFEGPAFDKGLIVKEMIPHSIPAGMQGFVMNTRREVFRDPRVRHAMSLAFDFEWTNANIFNGLYTRTQSYFANSEMASEGLPDAAELALLEPWRGQIPEEVFTTEYHAPKTDGSGRNRENLKQALALLQEAGWRFEDGRMMKDGKPLEFEFLLRDPAFERVALPYFKNLERIGVRATPRMVDDSQYINRMRAFDFDMTTMVFPQSNSPGNEQRDFFSAEAAEIPGSRNFMGVADPAVDALVEAIITAPDRDALVTACRALDRVLLWKRLVVPHWHLGAYRVAYWKQLTRPETTPPYGLDLQAWWIDPTKAAEVRAARGK